MQNIADTIKPDGTMSGDSYQALTRKGSPLDRAMSGGGNVGFYAGQIRDALDDALEQSASPQDLSALQDARTQYRNMKIVEGALPTDPNASLDPTKLMSAVRKATPNYAYTGGGALDDAAKAAAQRSATGPVAEQQYLHDLNLTGNNGAPTLNKLNGAMKDIASDPNSPLTPDTINKLTALRDDMVMDQGSDAGKARGSNTHQNFATDALTRAIGKAKDISGALGLLGGGSEFALSHDPFTGYAVGKTIQGISNAVGKTYAAKNALIQQALRNALLDPASVTLDTKVPTGSLPGKDGIISSLVKSNAIPAMVNTKNRLLGAS